MTRSLTERGLRQLRRCPAAPAGLIALAIIVYWSARDGATDPLILVPTSLMLVGLLVVVAWTAPGSMPGGRAGRIALLAFAAYVAWCYLSILWADVGADAWAGANQTLVYFVVYALFAIRPWQAGAAQAVLGAYSVGVAAVGIWVLLRLDEPDRRAASFIQGRLAEPISYVNANCALFAASVLPALYLGSRRETPVVLRGVFLATAGVLVQLAILCQSRMSLVALPIVLTAFFVLVPSRLRSLLALLLVVAAVMTSLSTLLAVFEAAESGEILPSIVDSQRAVVMSAVVLGFLGVAWGLLDRRFELPSRVVRAVGIGTIVLVACLGIASITLFAERYGSPTDEAAVAWERFKGDIYTSRGGAPHLVSGFAGAGRYDVWKVAWDVFERHPVTGAGVDNFGVDWLRERPNARDLISPHSVELRVLQQTGLVGAALLATFLGAALYAGWGALRPDTSAATRGTAAVALLLFGYWAIHGSIDWLWEIPALSTAAFASLGLVVALSPVGQEVRRPRLVPIALSVVGLFAVLALVPPWLSAREVATALDALRVDSAAAYVHLDRARSLNPLSDEPDVLAALIAAGQGDVLRQRALLLRALRRNPHNWYSYVELGLIDARREGPEAGMLWLDKAVALNPRDETIRFVIDRVRVGRPPARAEIDALFVRTAEQCCLP